MAQHDVYQPLEAGQIRLLNLLHDEREPHGIALSLRHAVLDDSKRKYVALSYTWGRPEPLTLDSAFQPDTIWRLKCNGGIIEVRQNLFDFLQQMRLNGPFATTFWIDAICIDQSNARERSEQVLHMGQIYTDACRVLIWLGKRPISIEVKQMTQQFIPAMLKDLRDRHYNYGFYRSFDILDENTNSVIIQSIGYEKWAMWKNSWQEFRALFMRNWFRRGWTVQEAILPAPEDSFMLVGSYYMNLKSIMTFGRLLTESRWPHTIEAPGAFHIVSVRSVGRYLFRYALPQSDPTGFDAVTLNQKWHADCLKLISMMRYMHVEDPRDRIYAYMGIMLQKKPPSVDNSIVPDYAVDVELIYQNFATVMLRNTRNLHILEMVINSQGRSYSKLPSWVPDFSQMEMVAALSGYDACKIHHNSMNTLEIKGNCLTLCGAQLGSISSFGQSEQNSLHRLAMYSIFSGIGIGKGQSVTEAVWRAVLRNDFEHYDREERPLRTRIRQWLTWQAWDLFHQDALQDSLSVLLARVTDDDNLKEWFPTLEQVMSPDPPSRDEELERMVKITLVHRQVYHMASEHCGIGPNSLQGDDQVWIVQGGHVPFILRQNEDGQTYTLLGPTYIHGFMYGEAMTDDFRSRFQPVTLV